MPVPHQAGVLMSWRLERMQCLQSEGRLKDAGGRGLFRWAGVLQHGSCTGAAAV